jgi:hypothetical protein
LSNCCYWSGRQLSFFWCFAVLIPCCLWAPLFVSH